MKAWKIFVIGLIIFILFVNGCTKKAKKPDISPAINLLLLSDKGENWTPSASWKEVIKPKNETVEKKIMVPTVIKKYMITGYKNDQWRITPNIMNRVVEVARGIKSIQSDIYIHLNGLASERGDTLYNFGLGQKRAEGVRNILKAKLPNAKIRTSSRGEIDDVRGVWVYVVPLEQEAKFLLHQKKESSLALLESDRVIDPIKYSFSGDGKKVKMEVIFRNLNDSMVGKTVCLHSRWKNHTEGRDDDAISLAKVMRGGKATFVFKNPFIYGDEYEYQVKLVNGSEKQEGYIERLWFTLEKMWPMPRNSPHLYKDSRGNRAIETLFTQNGAFPISRIVKDYPRDTPGKFGRVEDVYDLKKLSRCCN